jgi:hypothetical protein
VRSHYPVPEKRVESWKALKQLQAEGKVKAIGVANFNQAQIEELIAATGVTPAVNQIELHPWHQSSDLVAYCQGKGIVVQAYSPLTRAKMFKDAKLAALAKRYGKSPAQVLIRWSLQRGLVPLPKSANPERITENASVFDFEISKEDMQVGRLLSCECADAVTAAAVGAGDGVVGPQRALLRGVRRPAAAAAGARAPGQARLRPGQGRGARGAGAAAGAAAGGAKGGQVGHLSSAQLWRLAGDPRRSMAKMEGEKVANSLSNCCAFDPTSLPPLPLACLPALALSPSLPLALLPLFTLHPKPGG